jgi:hypothetical protein
MENLEEKSLKISSPLLSWRRHNKARLVGEERGLCFAIATVDYLKGEKNL